MEDLSMKHHIMIQLLFVLVSLSFLFGFAFSQNLSKDIIYLKNGSVIKGEIIEQIPNKSIKIQTSDGSIFVYDFSDIEKIAKEKVTTGSAQGSIAQDVPKGFHMHDGFYLSLTGGPAFGTITLNATHTSFTKMEFGGTGFQFDFKIGGVISEEANLILSFDLISRAISSPSLTVDGNTASTTSSVTAGDVLYGVGITKYFMPENIFINATVGIGVFSFGYDNNSGSSKSGFGFQIKGGKEWWVSDNWGLGVAVGLGYISADDQTDSSNPNYSATISTTKFFIVFNTTFN
jgi:hypothetical protein